MSTEAVGSTSGVPAGELALAQRVRQLQALIEESREVSVEGATPNLPSGSTATGASSAVGSVLEGTASPAGPPGQASTSFAAALQAATTADAAPAAPIGTQGAANPGGTGSTSQYDPLIEQAAARYGVDPAVLHGLIQQESGFDPEAQSSAGASGLTQLMPGTASSLGVTNPLNPAESIEGGARYLSQMMSRFGGNTEDALAAYNAGPGAVQQYGGVPPYAETQSYVQKVLGYADAYRQARGAPSSLGVAA
ncbi:MAG: lytic transglycosylase domain-containing protein [Solirubrobacteraceae bacterium]